MLKKLFSLTLVVLLSFMYVTPALAANETIEHLDVHKNAPCNLVAINGCQKTVKKDNVLLFTFSEKFLSKQHIAGEIIHFDVPQALYTVEGTQILPANSKVVAEITKIQKPRVWNRNARVSLIFRQVVFPDGSCYDIKAMPFTKDQVLKEGPWTTFGKVALCTLSLGAIGTGAGVGFAFIPNPAQLGVGIGVGVAVGAGVGLIVGLVTPGCHYKAKKGEEVYALLLDDMCVCNK